MSEGKRPWPFRRLAPVLWLLGVLFVLFVSSLITSSKHRREMEARIEALQKQVTVLSSEHR